MEQHIWEPSAAPMHRVHADFAGPFLGHWFFIVVDSYSKWPEVRIVKNLAAKTIIEECREIFAMYGVPQIFVTDNGRTFTSSDFKAFLERNGVIFKYTAPYNSATNGQAERFVQTLKNALRRMDANAANVYEKLCKMLLQYRIAPHATTNRSPAELFLGRKLRTRLDLLLPSHEEDGAYMPYQNDSKSFKIGERVSCRNFVGRDKWRFGRIKDRCGKLHYLISLDDGRTWRRHVNQMRSIGQATPKQNPDFDYGSVEDSMIRTDTNVSERGLNEQEHPEELLQKVPQHPPDHPQP